MIITSNHESNCSGVDYDLFTILWFPLYGNTGYQVYSDQRIGLVIRQMSPYPMQRPKQTISNYSQVVSVHPKSIIVQFIPP